MTDLADASIAVPPPGSFWHRRFVQPVVEQFRQGISPEKIALTISLGFTLSIFPILGATTILCLLAGLIFRLNQPMIQVVCYASYPLQILLLVPFYRAGETLFGQPHVPLSIPILLARVRASFPQFLKDFGLIGLEGITVWCLIAPLSIAVLHFALLPSLRALSRPSVR